MMLFSKRPDPLRRSTPTRLRICCEDLLLQFVRHVMDWHLDRGDWNLHLWHLAACGFQDLI